MYKVLIAFADLEDGNYIYRAGDTYPRRGFKASDERLEERASSENKQNRPLIEKVGDVEKEEEKPIEEKPIEEPVMEEAIEEVKEEKKPKKKASKKKEK